MHDALGSPRVVTNSFGEVKSRRDFLAFGEELYAGLASRAANQKYSSSTDDVRKKFATYQRDSETGLDFAQSRYYSAMQGRFTSPDEFKGGPDELFDFEEDAADNPTFYADLSNPQSLNKYQYGYNNPYKFNDPSGHCPPCLAWAVFEVVSAAADVVVAVQTVRDPNASRAEKIGTVLGAAASITLPGGGYGIGAKVVVKALRREATETVVKKTAPATQSIKGVSNSATPARLNAKQRRQWDRTREAERKKAASTTNSKDYNQEGRRKIQSGEDASDQAEGLRAAQKKKRIDSTKKSDDRELIKQREDYLKKKKQNDQN
ncbi:MAG: RHS repeat-associated core domain-containing protein [Acidobacteriota bacterium]